VEVNVIEGRKNFGAVARRHVLGNFVHARPIVDMAVGVDDLHDLSFLSKELRRL
jgi:hypothetical protein